MQEVQAIQALTVSVVVPVYNSVQYLQQCVDSILTQTVQDIELILVNDGSTDGSAALCDAIAAQDARVLVIHQPENLGVSAARNRGIEAAQGKYLYFSDADDYLSPTALAFLSNLLETHPDCDSAGCTYLVNEEELHEPNETPVVWQRPLALRAVCDYGFSVLKGSSCNKMFRRRVLVEQGVRFDEASHICEDLLFCMTYLSVSGDMIYHAVPQYHYVHRAVSAMHAGLTERRVNVLDTYEKIMALVAPQGDAHLDNILKINYLNHHLHMLQVTWKVRDAETMCVAGEIYRSFRPHLGWFLRQKNARAKRKLIALFFFFTAWQFPKAKKTK